GKKVRCTACRNVFQVGPGPAPDRPVETGIRKGQDPAATPAAARRPRREEEDADRLQTGRGSRSGSNPLPWILGGGAGVLALACAVLGGLLLGRSQPPEPTGSAPTGITSAVAAKQSAAAPLPAPAAAASAPVEPGGKDDAIPLQTLQAIKDAT